MNEIQAIVDLDPFRNVKVTAETRLYVSFFSGKTDPIKIPSVPPGKGYRILHVRKSEAFSVITLSPTVNSTDLMGFLEKQFGKRITTRNWNTVLKILDSLPPAVLASGARH
jgi:uncharacterized protein (DUF1697 family)